MIYTQIISNLPEEMRWPMVQLVEQMREDLSQTVTKEDFHDLKKDLDDRLDTLNVRQSQTERYLEQLTGAQLQTEKRIHELAQAQAQTEKRMDQLIERMDQLAERMDQLAERMDQLAERMDQLAERMDQLAEAQEKTEKIVQGLLKGQKSIREELGGLGHTVGYRLEDEAIWALPRLLERDHGIHVVDQLTRDYVEVTPGSWEEVNIFGKGTQDGQELVILGEAKSQLKKKQVDAFLKFMQKFTSNLGGEVFPVLITYQTSPQIRTYASEHGIALYFSYELR